MWPVILAEPVNHQFCVFGPIVRWLILQFAHVDSLNSPMWIFAWAKLQPTQSEWARPRCVIQSVQTWRLSLAFPQTQPFKSLQSPHTQNPHAESLKSHAHQNSCKRRKDKEVIVEAQAVTSPPLLPTLSWHMLGVSSQGSTGKTYTHWNDSNNPTPSNPIGFWWFQCGTSFLFWLLHSKRILQTEVLRKKWNLFFWVFFSTFFQTSFWPKVLWVLISLALVASALLWFNSQLVWYFWANPLQMQSMKQKCCLQLVAWPAKIKGVKQSYLS